MLNRLVIAGVGLAAVLAFVAPSRADVVVLFDGRRFSGQVTISGDYYFIQTKMGMVRVIKDDVSDVLPDNPDSAPRPAPPKPVTPALPVTPPPPAPEPVVTTPPPPPPAEIPPINPPANPPDNPKPTEVAVVPSPVPELPPVSQSEMLARSGIEALGGGDNKAARDLLLDSLQLDAKNPRALHALLIAYLRMGDAPHARSSADRLLAIVPQPTWNIVVNICAVDVAQQRPMEAVKMAREYFQDRPDSLKEPLINAFGIAIDHADEQSRNSPLYQDSLGVYMLLNGRLESNRAGEKRFGVHWMPADQADAKKREIPDIRERFLGLKQDLASADARMVAATLDLNKVQKQTPTRRNRASFEEQLAERNLQAAQAAYEDAKAKFNAYLPNLPFPLKVELAPLDAADEPLPKPVVVAIAPPPPPKPVVKPPQHTGPLWPNHTPEHPNPAPVTPSPEPVVDANPTPDSAPPAPPSHSNDHAEPAGPVIASGDLPEHFGGGAFQSRPYHIPRYAAAFPISTSLVVTAADVVRGASQICLTGADGIPMKAELVRTDSACGLALLRVTNARLRYMCIDDAFAGGAVHCAAYPTPNMFNPIGQLLAATAPAASDEDWVVSFTRNPRLPGAPLLANGKVVGVELGTRDADMAKIPAINGQRLKQFVGGDVGGGEYRPDALAVLLQVTAGQ